MPVPSAPVVELTMLFLNVCHTLSFSKPLQFGHNLPLTS
nr:MAG TPA: hypothetical protein [Caudoviricetes sp.]